MDKSSAIWRALIGPLLSKRALIISVIASSWDQSLELNSGCIRMSLVISGNTALYKGNNSAAIRILFLCSDKWTNRPSLYKASSHLRQPWIWVSRSVIKPAVISASWNSSGSLAWGHASCCTLDMAPSSSKLRSFNSEGSLQRLFFIALVLLSSKGASSKKAYGLALIISCEKTDGSRRSFTSIPNVLFSKFAMRFSNSTISIASDKQSSIVWLTNGWSGTSRFPTMFSWQAIWSGNTWAMRSSASIRWNCGGILLPARFLCIAKDLVAFQRHLTSNIGASSMAWISTSLTVALFK